MEKKGNKTHFWKGKNLMASWARLSTRLKKVKKKTRQNILVGMIKQEQLFYEHNMNGLNFSILEYLSIC